VALSAVCKKRQKGSLVCIAGCCPSKFVEAGEERKRREREREGEREREREREREIHHSGPVNSGGNDNKKAK